MTTGSSPVTTRSGPVTTGSGPETTGSGPETTGSGPETTGSGPETTDAGRVDARRIAERVTSCPDVAGLSAGPFGAIATYLPGESVPGISLRGEEIEVHVIVRYGRPMPEIAAEIRDAIGDLARGRRVDITIDDVTGIEEPRKVRSS
ncbi:hypothetical protein [Microtetraspora sp. NBRC 16547]|uniref:hypothetical protein n=1 Tax=Microtetraspora sp. NBRC 16547 TaxID=3030993 RepID=UPI0024A52D00|nr:hypothetical protein [Microtetraspora sp. NBRC 16547]GLW98683.1 hypothetical protein Misp02_27700 [Microtetraspora sp. NBRC 16547]